MLEVMPAVFYCLHPELKKLLNFHSLKLFIRVLAFVNFS
jgi:hypothetical protein